MTKLKHEFYQESALKRLLLALGELDAARPADTPLVQFDSDLLPSRPFVAYDQNGRIQLVTNGIDRISEDQVLQAAVPVGAHDQQIRSDLARVLHDFAPRVGRVADGGLDAQTGVP